MEGEFSPGAQEAQKAESKKKPIWKVFSRQPKKVVQTAEAVTPPPPESPEEQKPPERNLPESPEMAYQQALEEFKTSEGLKPKYGELPKWEIKHRNFGAKDRLRHQALLSEARMRGLKNPRQFQEFMEFMESNFTDRAYGAFKRYKGELTDEQKEKIKEKNAKSGYSTHISFYEGKTGVTASREVQYDLKRSDIPLLIKMANSSPKAFELTRELYQDGLRFNSAHLSPEYIDKIVKVASSPKVEELIRIVTNLKRINLYPDREGKNWSQIDPLADLATFSEKDLSTFSPEIINRINTLTSLTGDKIDLEQLEGYKKIASDPSKFELTTQLIRGDKVPSPEIIERLFDSGLAESLISLHKVGIKEDTDITKENPEEVLQSLRVELGKPELREVLNNPQMMEYARVYGRLIGHWGEARVSISQLSEVVGTFGMRQEFTFIMRLMQGGYKPSGEGYFDRAKMLTVAKEMAMNQKELVGRLSSPEFRQFFQTLTEKYGYKPKADDFYAENHRYIQGENFHWESGSNLEDLFNNHEVRDALSDPQVESMVKQLNLEKGINLENINDYISLAKNPDTLFLLEIARERGLISTDEKMDSSTFNKLVGITKLPLVQGDILAKLPTGEKDRWLRNVIFCPETVQQSILKEINEHGGELTQEILDKNYKIGELSKLISDSPSQEIKRIQPQLLDQLWRVDNPTEIFKEIQSVFEKNNLPIVGKIYRVFEIIYDRKTSEKPELDQRLDVKSNLSPVLQAASPKERRDIIYRDLLGVHIDSENPSLSSYISVLQEGQGIVEKFEQSDESSLTPDEKLKLEHFLDKMDTLYVNSLFGRRAEQRKRDKTPEGYQSPQTKGLTINERILALKHNFKVGEKQTLTSRLEQLYLRHLGINTFQEALDRMRSSKENADKRNKEFVSQGQSPDEVITLKTGDRLKGINGQFFQQILENGSVAKEYLGASADSDATPFDTDTSVIQEADLEKGVSSALEASIDKNYGNLVLIVRDRGQFNRTDGQNPNYESFSSGVVGERHFGIRTGFPTTEIDGIIAKGMSPDGSNMESVFLNIAQNGFYIPVLDEQGTVVFTPEMYQRYKDTFRGIDSLHGDTLTVRSIGETQGIDQRVISKTAGSVNEVEAQIKLDAERTQALERSVREKVGQVLEQNGIKLRDPYDTSIYGGDFFDTGSTGRLTNEPGSADFDFMLLLDAKDQPKYQAVADQLKSILSAKEDRSHSETESGYIQIRAIGARGIGTEPLDVDIGVGKRGDFSVFGSHDAIAAKLDSIKESYGEETYYQVLANIVLAKRVLKEGKAYKKLEDGGFGGIGVENWILANNGNVLEAFRSFYEAAHENGRELTLVEFEKRYKLFDAGINVKYNSHDNFTETLKPAGYEAMLRTIRKYLGV